MSCRVRWCLGLLAMCWALLVHAQDFEEVKRGAERGDAAAQYQLGVMIHKAGGGNPDRASAEAKKWFGKAAEQGHAPAKVIVEVMSVLEQGKNGNLALDAGTMRQLRKAAEQGDPMAQFHLGAMLWMRGERMGGSEGRGLYLEGFEWLHKAAEQGDTMAMSIVTFRTVTAEEAEAGRRLQRAAEQADAAAQNELGEKYEYGRGGMPKDKARAEQWYRKAAEQGYAPAQVNLGSLLSIAQKPDEAEQWYLKAAQLYRKAAEQGDAQAQYRLGEMYGMGHGVPRDDAEAKKWYRKAAEQGHRQALFAIGDTRGAEKAGERENAERFRKKAQEGDAEAQFIYGAFCHDGRGVAKDEAEAAKWFLKAAQQYRKAAEQGDARAQARLGQMYLEGLGMARDDAEAMKWYRMAAEQGSGAAQSALGEMYLHGWGVAPDGVEAEKWYRKAGEHGVGFENATSKAAGIKAANEVRKLAEQGDAAAQHELGRRYAKGAGVAENKDEAEKWYRKAAEQGYGPAELELGMLAPTPAESMAWIRKAAEHGDERARALLERRQNRARERGASASQ